MATTNDWSALDKKVEMTPWEKVRKLVPYSSGRTGKMKANNMRCNC